MVLMDAKELERRFTYHKPFGTQPERYERIRFAAHVMANHIMDCCPESRESALAFTKLQEAVMWANASIACNEVPPEKEEI